MLRPQGEVQSFNTKLSVQKLRKALVLKIKSWIISLMKKMNVKKSFQ